MDTCLDHLATLLPRSWVYLIVVIACILSFYFIKTRFQVLGRTELLQPIAYCVVKGLFLQDDDDFDPNQDTLRISFGLKDTSRNRWIKLVDRINKLNDSSDDHTAYKLFFVARHGEGVHNVAEAKYGTHAWNEYWSHLRGDGKLVWGPDPALTIFGERQALDINSTWKTERTAGIPLPMSFYSSPLRRATNTLQLTWSNVQLNKGILPLIMEDLRETIGTHTCDQRSTKSQIAAQHPKWLFSTGFTEHDNLYKPPYEETDAEHDRRTRRVLDYIFATDASACVSITAHGGSIHSLFNVIDHWQFQPPPGGVVPIVVKAEGQAHRNLPVTFTRLIPVSPNSESLQKISKAYFDEKV